MNQQQPEVSLGNSGGANIEAPATEEGEEEVQQQQQQQQQQQEEETESRDPIVVDQKSLEKSADGEKEDNQMEVDPVSPATVFCVKLKQPNSNLLHKMSVPELCRNFRFDSFSDDPALKFTCKLINSFNFSLYFCFVCCQCRCVVWQIECYSLRFRNLCQDSKV